MFIYFTAKRQIRVGIQDSEPERGRAWGLRGVGGGFSWSQGGASAFKVKNTFHWAVKIL